MQHSGSGGGAGGMTREPEAAQLMRVVEAMASRPDASIEAVERMMALYERADARRAEREYTDAMLKVQAELRPVAADLANPQTRSRYASYMALHKTTKPVFTANGFTINYDTEPGTPADPVPDLHVRVVAIVSHISGHTRRHRIDMPADGKGAKGNDVMTRTHATGSAISYGRRYLLLMIGDIPIGADEDDDGNRASAPRPNGIAARATGAADPDAPINAEQVTIIQNLITRTKSNMPKFLTYFDAPSIEQMRLRDFPRAKTMLEAKLPAPASPSQAPPQAAQQPQAAQRTQYTPHHGQPGEDDGWPGSRGQ